MQELNLVLNNNCSIKYLEKPCLYNKISDTLYELDKEATDFLLHYPESSFQTGQHIKHFIDYCHKEGILIDSSTCTHKLFAYPSPLRYGMELPSLRYLLLHITKSCNLRCRHCYYDSSHSQNESLSYEQVLNIFAQMERVQGLIILISGGEPLCHPDFWRINEVLPQYNLRFELLTNGTLIDCIAAKKLNFHHVQISIDGMEKSHDYLRGQGSFRKALSATKYLLRVGKKISISSMVYSKNIGDFESLSHVLSDVRIEDWTVNVPSFAGRWRENKDFAVSLELAADCMIKYSRGEGPHDSIYDFTCGTHICTVLSDASIYPCPFLADNEMRMGSIFSDNLWNAWMRKKDIALTLEECNDCEYREVCKGGCRFRAKENGSICGKDPIMCMVYKRNKMEVSKR